MSGFVTIPNTLSTFRLLASPTLILAAWLEQPQWCLVLTAVLWFTDWLDGKLAHLLDQSTSFGARLDSLADAVFYLSVLLAMVLLDWEMVRREALWLGVAFSSYGLSAIVGLIKYRRLPSYHTYLAKTSWWLMGLALLSIFANLEDAWGVQEGLAPPGFSGCGASWATWPLRVALVTVVLTNLEATAISVVLPTWRADVLSIFHARLIKKDEAGEAGD